MHEPRPHEKLDVWKKAMDLCVEVYKTTAHFPASEKYGLTSQMRRAAVSVVSNIAEGAGRGTTKLYIHFLYVSQGSLSELDAQLEIAMRLSFIDQNAFNNLKSQTSVIGKMLTNLIKSLKKK